jgi:hypothetical protein
MTITLTMAWLGGTGDRNILDETSRCTAEPAIHKCRKTIRRSLEPIPVKKLKDQIVFVDGHTRALAAFIHGLSSVLVYWEHEELDWEAYEICVEWCKKERIRTIGDLKDRVIPHEKYKVFWYDRCEKMQQDLKKRRQLRIEKERR